MWPQFNTTYLLNPRAFGPIRPIHYLCVTLRATSNNTAFCDHRWRFSGLEPSPPKKFGHMPA